MKNPYKNLHALLKKTLLQVFIISILFCSCYNAPRDLNFCKKEDDLGFVFGDNKQSKNFYAKANFQLSKVFTEEIPHHQKLPDCCHNPIGEVKDAFLICLVPGFKVEDIDPYSPLIAKALKNIIMKKFKGKEDQVCIETKIFSRWGNFSKDNRDNETFETQYFILHNQLEFQIKKLQEIYTKNINIHVIFVGESYGGKISLFFLDQLLENFHTPRVSFDILITIHSPLHKMQMSYYALKSKFLNSPMAHMLTSSFDALDFLNVKDYKTTFEILSSEYINDVTTVQALENLKRKNVKIFNFIGTPSEIHFGDSVTTFGIFANSFLDKVNIINAGLRLTFQLPIEDNDSLLTFLHDQDYTNNSDFVVKTSETIKDSEVIEIIKTQRDHLQIYQVEGMTFFVSPNIIHLGSVFNLELFERDLQHPNLVEYFDKAIG